VFHLRSHTYAVGRFGLNYIAILAVFGCQRSTSAPSWNQERTTSGASYDPSTSLRQQKNPEVFGLGVSSLLGVRTYVMSPEALAFMPRLLFTRLTLTTSKNIFMTPRRNHSAVAIYPISYPKSFVKVRFLFLFLLCLFYLPSHSSDRL
jgi:hypothetical protein